MPKFENHCTVGTCNWQLTEVEERKQKSKCIHNIGCKRNERTQELKLTVIS